MEVTIYKKPCILLEAAELVYALINEVPAEKMTTKGEYCIPPEEIRKIQDAACAGLDKNDRELQFYFHGVPVGGKEWRPSCLANCLLYTSLDVRYASVDEMVAALRKCRLQQKKPYQLHGIDEFALSLTEAEQYTTISQEVTKLPVPQSYQMQLIEVLSSYEWHLDRLAELLRPVAERLEPLLAPWVEHAAPLAAKWEEFLAEPSGLNALLQLTQVGNIPIKALHIALRYFFSYCGPGTLYDRNEMYCLHLGVAVLPGAFPTQSVQLPEGRDFSAFRLLSSTDRVQMLQAMMKRPMSVQDLCQSLGLNPGTVFRDLNNLYNAHLLTLEMISGRNCYRTSLPAIEELTNRLIQYLKQEQN